MKNEAENLEKAQETWTLTVQPTSTVYFLDSIDRFLNKHPRLSTWITCEEPYYALPEELIQSLENELRRPNLKGVFDFQAELDFTALCDEQQAIGFWMSKPIHFQLLSKPLPTPMEEGLLATGLSLADVRAVQDSLEGNDYSNRQRSVIGWLLTNPQFLKERDALRECWNKAPVETRPEFPLNRAQVELSVPTENFEFRQKLDRFLARWELLDLNTWDLPHPPGPMFPNLLPPNSIARPKSEVHFSVPSHFPLLNRDQIHQTVVDMQQAARSERGDEEKPTSKDSVQLYGHIFQVIHYKQAIRQRFSSDQDVTGLARAMESALANFLGMSVEYIQKIRKRTNKQL